MDQSFLDFECRKCVFLLIFQSKYLYHTEGRGKDRVESEYDVINIHAPEIFIIISESKLKVIEIWKYEILDVNGTLKGY